MLPHTDELLVYGGWPDFGGKEAFNDTWWYDPEGEFWTPATPVSP